MKITRLLSRLESLGEGRVERPASVVWRAEYASIKLEATPCEKVHGCLHVALYRLRVEQRPSEGQVDFSLVPSGSKLQLMRRFNGTWRIDKTGGSSQASCLGDAQDQQPVLLTLQQVSGLELLLADSSMGAR